MPTRCECLPDDFAEIRANFRPSCFSLLSLKVVSKALGGNTNPLGQLATLATSVSGRGGYIRRLGADLFSATPSYRASSPTSPTLPVSPST